MQNVKALFLFSEMHKHKLERALQKLKSGLDELKIEVVEDPADLTECPLCIIVHLTGGTGLDAYRLLMRSKNHSLLLSYRGNNSLASALSAYSRLRHFARDRVRLVYLEDLYDFTPLKSYLKVFEAIEHIKSTRIAYMDTEELDLDALRFQSKFGVDITPIPPSKLDETMSAGFRDEDMRTLEVGLRVEPGANISLTSVVKVYLTFKKIVEEGGYGAVTVNCFNFIERRGVTPCLAMSLLNKMNITAACEADFRSLLLLMLSHKLTGLPGWIGNIVESGGTRINMAHCTVAANLAETFFMTTHFETGKPAAVAGRIRPGKYTIASIDPFYRELRFGLVWLRKSGLFSDYACRTQAILEPIGFSADDFVDGSISNHHVLIPGDVTSYLEKAGWMLDMKTINISGGAERPESRHSF